MGVNMNGRCLRVDIRPISSRGMRVLCLAPESEQRGLRDVRPLFPLQMTEQRGRINEGVAEPLARTRIVIRKPRVARMGVADRLGADPILVAEPIGLAFGVDDFEIAGTRVEDGNRRYSAESQNRRTGREVRLQL